MIRRRVASSLIALVLALSLLPSPSAHAQDATYRTPPAPVGDILNAPKLPRGTPSISPDGARMIVPDLPSLISIASLAEPVEKLAALEILSRLRANRQSIKLAATGMN